MGVSMMSARETVELVVFIAMVRFSHAPQRGAGART